MITRADQIFRRFVKFHECNPEVWALIKHYTQSLIDAGFNNYSIDAVFHRVRWHINMETKSQDGLKLNDHYTAYYSRMFHVAYPQHDGFFRIRRRTSTDRSAYREDLALCYCGDPDNESALNNTLAKLI